LIDNRNLAAGLKGRSPMNEDQFTRLLLERGEAELAESEKRWRAASKQGPPPAASQASAETPAERPSAPARENQAPRASQNRKPVKTPDRRQALQEMAVRLTGKRRGPIDEKPS
jgi:pyruvate/2-oxoglutarate dehydrogenase complex dihydrolipoamide acyltransferase (E2) component